MNFTSVNRRTQGASCHENASKLTQAPALPSRHVDCHPPPLPCLDAPAAELTGRVVCVTDRDRITTLDADKVQHTIRLEVIDAPESKQAIGTKAKPAVSERMFKKTSSGGLMDVARRSDELAQAMVVGVLHSSVALMLKS
jgi:endonuclease YncB( thermonuclease family)